MPQWGESESAHPLVFWGWLELSPSLPTHCSDSFKEQAQVSQSFVCPEAALVSFQDVLEFLSAEKTKDCREAQDPKGGSSGHQAAGLRAGVVALGGGLVEL